MKGEKERELKWFRILIPGVCCLWGQGRIEAELGNGKRGINEREGGNMAG